ncbi:probable septum site-determining protein minC [Helicobacter bizzozeronii CIII-1]|uniref:Probable septum site-determining protein minC n=1 Tax=Helicobacter bizzozeronii (strain CIII-1) TaxID=1002804 RepID=F8KS66_HELBC|nr:septum site-determining protein MinC [Helicobacter bizzozeronii]CCB79621.1 probable septum site-determining protein minC [Helicobacter bizzozeronii CIII-1]
MLRTRQKQVRCFELGVASNEQYLTFIHKNAPLLQDYLLLFRAPIDSEVLGILQHYQLAYSVSTKELKGRPSDQVVVYEALDLLPPQEPPTPPKPAKALIDRVQIFERNIRSGEEIDSAFSLVFLGNINHGAKIYSDQNISVYGRCEGIIICMGVCMIIRNIHSSHIAFQGVVLDPTQLARINQNTKLKLITKNDDMITIKDIL